ncbi:MAG TPA: collagen-like protein [Candidatus Nitrosocosmicus sp.]|nr:collagen-like protein [Candidatus Nitrosocosmicus sp.]
MSFSIECKKYLISAITMKLTNNSMKLFVLLTFTLVFSTVTTGFIPRVSVTVSIDFDLDEYIDLPGLDLLRGQPGSQGSQGEQGPAGTPTQEKVLTIRTVKGNTVRSGVCSSPLCSEPDKSVASCPDDEVLTGGGSEHSGGDFRLDFSRPNGDSWEARGSQMSQDPSFTQAYAQCQN